MRILIIILAFFATSCATQRRCAERFPVKVEKKDSIVYKEKYIKIPPPIMPKRPNAIMAKKDTVVVYDTVDCPNENKKGTSKSGNLTVGWEIKNNKLKILANNLSDTIQAQKMLIDSLNVKVVDTEKYSSVVKVVSVENQSLKKDVKYQKRIIWLLLLVIFILGFGHVARSYNSMRKTFKFLP